MLSSRIVMWQAGFIHRFAGENQISTNHRSRWACLFLHIWQPRSRLHVTSPAALSSSRNAQRCSESKTAASPSQSLQKTSHLLQALVQRVNAIQLFLQGLPTCMRDPLFYSFASCTFPVVIYYPRTSSQFWAVLLSTEVTYCFQQESAIASHEWGRFPTSLVINISTARA